MKECAPACRAPPTVVVAVVSQVNASRTPKSAGPIERLGLNPWLQVFLTIIAGAAVAVIVWSVVQRFLHIIALLVASFLVAYLLSPLVDRMERGGLRRGVAILLVYLAIFSVIALVFVLLLGPLTTQLHGLVNSLPALVSGKSGGQTRLDTYFRQHGIKLSVEGIRTQIAGYISSAGTTLLGSTLSIVTSIVSVVTDLLLVLAITFYLLLDGHGMRNRAVRLLPAGYRDRWFFFEAALNKVLGGYIRGQLIVALTVGIAAGLGCGLLGVQYPLVIGLLAFLFEFIPMLGPVLGMLPAVLIALFQPSPVPLVIWVVIYFIVLQQIESNAIVPRVSGHAVGLHPLAALLALLIGLELGGLGGALLSVPLAGVVWVLLVAYYGDVTGQTHIITRRQPQPAYVSLARQVIERRRPREAAETVSLAHEGIDGPVRVRNERLEAIKQEQEHLIEQFEADEAVLTAHGTGPTPDDAHAPATQ